jgi:hypothetical protein
LWDSRTTATLAFESKIFALKNIKTIKKNFYRGSDGTNEQKTPKNIIAKNNDQKV